MDLHTQEIYAIEKALAGSSKNKIPQSLKMMIVEILFRIIDREKKPFGLLIVLGWQERWQKFAGEADASQDVLAGHRIGSNIDPKQYRKIAKTTAFDGAILIDKDGTILHSGVMIEGLRPREIAAKLNPGSFSDLSTQFGFTEKVHTRHLTAIASSYAFKGTTVFTVSEESGSIHIFENGRILYATPKKKKSRSVLMF